MTQNTGETEPVEQVSEDEEQPEESQYETPSWKYGGYSVPVVHRPFEDLLK